MNILITGAFGFVGTNLAKSLKQANKHHLIALDLEEPASHIFDAFVTWGDLPQFDWSTINAIIHLAGKAHDTSNTADANTYFDINLGLTQRMVDYFSESAASKFIFFSSVKAVADTVEDAILTESSVCNPKTPYGQSKLAAEQYLLSKQLPAGKLVFVLRPCMIHGPGNKGNLNLLYKLAQKGLPWPLGAFENSRSFTSIQNLQFVINQLIDRPVSPGVYQVADDEPLSTNQLVQLMAESLQRKARIWKLSAGFIRFLAKTGDKLHLPLNTERLKKLTESYVVSNEQLKGALGINHMPVSSADGMKQTFASFL